MATIFTLLLMCAMLLAIRGQSDGLGSFGKVCKKSHYMNGSGYVPYPNECGKFIQCWKLLKTYLVRSCPPGLHWDNTAETCNFPAAAKCPGGYGYFCQENWIRHGTSCYLFIGNKKTWTEASQTCATRGAALAAVETGEENNFIRGYLKVFAGLGANMACWIGGTDIELEGIWKWSPSGKRMTFTDWFPSEPQKPDGGDCLVVWPSSFHWADYKCYDKASFICEKPTTTEPSIGED